MSEAARKLSDTDLLVEFDRRLRDLERTSLNTSKSAQRWHIVGDVNDPIAPAYGSGWQTGFFAGLHAGAAFYKDGTGMVHLRGRAVQVGPGPLPNKIFDLPPGFAPVPEVPIEIPLVRAFQSQVTTDQITNLNITGGGVGGAGAVNILAPPNGGAAYWTSVYLYNIHFYAG